MRGVALTVLSGYSTRYREWQRTSPPPTMNPPPPPPPRAPGPTFHWQTTLERELQQTHQGLVGLFVADCTGCLATCKGLLFTSSYGCLQSLIESHCVQAACMLLNAKDVCPWDRNPVLLMEDNLLHARPDSLCFQQQTAPPALDGLEQPHQPLMGLLQPYQPSAGLLQPHKPLMGLHPSYAQAVARCLNPTSQILNLSRK